MTLFRRLKNRRAATALAGDAHEPMGIEFDQGRLHLFGGKTQQALTES